MPRHLSGPPAGTVGVCDGCNVEFTRSERGQRYHDGRCKVVNGPWRYGSLWASRGAKDAPNPQHRPIVGREAQ